MKRILEVQAELTRQGRGFCFVSHYMEEYYSFALKNPDFYFHTNSLDELAEKLEEILSMTEAQVKDENRKSLNKYFHKQSDEDLL